jgi:hypothetical protein
MALRVLHDLGPLPPNTPLLFVSFRGELNQQLKVNKILFEEGEVLPAAFSLSVFNTPPALSSMALGLQAGYAALYPAGNRFSVALLSAAAMLKTASSLRAVPPLHAPSLAAVPSLPSVNPASPLINPSSGADTPSSTAAPSMAAGTPFLSAGTLPSPAAPFLALVYADEKPAPEYQRLETGAEEESLAFALLLRGPTFPQSLGERPPHGEKTCTPLPMPGMAGERLPQGKKALPHREEAKEEEEGLGLAQIPQADCQSPQRFLTALEKALPRHNGAPHA